MEVFVSLKIKSIWKRIKELRSEEFNESFFVDMKNEEAMKILKDSINQEFLRCHNNEDTLILIQLRHEFDDLVFMCYTYT